MKKIFIYLIINLSFIISAEAKIKKIGNGLSIDIPDGYQYVSISLRKLLSRFPIISKDFTKKDIKIKTTKGIAILQKTDIFKKIVWYSYKNNFMDWHEIDLKSLNKMIEINKSGKEVSSLEDFSIHKEEVKKLISEDSITRFDKKKKRKYAI